MRTIAILALALFFVPAIAGAANQNVAGNPTNPKIVLVTKCGTGTDHPGHVYSGKGTILKVRKNGCATIDKGATALAYDDSVVAAHGESIVIGYGHATLIIYNQDVVCAVHGKNVSIIWALRGGYVPSGCQIFAQ